MAENPETIVEAPVPETTTPASLEELKEPGQVAHPDMKKHRAEEDRIKKEIEALEAQLDDISNKVRKAQKASNGQGDEMGAIRTELNRLKKENDSLRKQRQEIFNARDELRESKDKQMNEMAKIKSQTKYKTVNEINTAIARLEKEQSTTSMPLAREKELIKEIGELKQAKKLIKQHEAAVQQPGQATPADYAAQLTNINGQLAELKKQMDTHKAQLAKMYEKRKDAPVNGLMKKRDELRAQKKEKHDELRKLRDEFKVKLNAWKKNQDEWKQYKDARDKLKKIEFEQRREAERKAREEELLKKTPYEEEMQLCDYLATYLTTTFAGSHNKTEQPSQDKQEKTNKPAAAAADYGVELESKKGKDDPYLVLGGKKKKGKKGKGGSKNTKRGQIVLVPETIDAFALLNMTPPTSADQVPETLKALEEKKAWFSTLPRGEIESIAEKNQKFEDQKFERRPNNEKKKNNNKKNSAPKTSDLEDFPSLGGPSAPAAEPSA